MITTKANIVWLVSNDS